MRPSDLGASSDRPLEIDRREFLIGVLPATIATVAAIESATAAAVEPIPELAPLPPADQPLSRVAFGACHKLDRPFGVWDVMRARDPQLFIFLRDTVYFDTID